jgi:putative SOS response-associated peptidase YedK
VPFNSFAEVCAGAEPGTKKKDVVWFAINDDRPLTCFAGIWTEFKGDRGTKSKPIPGPHNVYGFLTKSPTAECSCRANPSQGDAGHLADG